MQQISNTQHAQTLGVTWSSGKTTCLHTWMNIVQRHAFFGVCLYVLLLQPIRAQCLARAAGVDYAELRDSQPCQMADNGSGLHPA